MNEIDLAYTAGIIDGEGCICLSLVKEKNIRGRRQRLTVSVGNTDKRLTLWLKNMFGGHSVLQSRTRNNKDYYQWRVSSKKASFFLSLILPYLKLKRRQAELGIEFQEPIYQGRRIDDNTWGLQEAQRILMQSLNARGIKR